MSEACAFCDDEGGEVLWRDVDVRVVAPAEPDYPGFLRVIWNRHVRELTDLSHDERQRLMDVVFASESALRAEMAPDKMNVASLGNVVPHVHVHVIPRYHDDPHYPNPIWGQRVREPTRIHAGDWMTRVQIALTEALRQ